MKTNRSAIYAVAILLSACSTTAGPGDSEADRPPPDSAGVVDWNHPAKIVDLGDGWTIHACEGDAPLLCVERDGSPVGSVEASAYPIESFDDLDPDADADADTILAAFAAGFLTALTEDRSVGCGADYGFDPIEPEPFVLGNTPGVSFGFVGTMPGGEPSELNLQYATIVGDDIISIVAAAYDENGCPGRDDLSGFDSPMLADFRPWLEQVLNESPLPTSTP